METKSNKVIVGGVDLGRVFGKYLQHWYLFVITISIGYYMANDYNKRQTALYAMKTYVMMEERSGNTLLADKVSAASGQSFLGSKQLQNQIALLRSHGQVKKIIQVLDFESSYFKKEEFYWLEIYKDAPFTVELIPGHNQVRYKRFNVEFVDKNRFRLYYDNGAFGDKDFYALGDTIAGEHYAFILKQRSDSVRQNEIGVRYGFINYDIDNLAHEYKHKISIHEQKGNSVLEVSTTSPNKQKGIDFLNTLANFYLQYNLETKNKKLINMIAFVSSQLHQIGVELDSSEAEIEQFRIENKFMKLSNKAAGLLNRMNKQGKTRADLILDLKYYEYLKDYLKNNDQFDDIVAPSTVGVSLPLFTALMEKLALLVIEKDNLLANSTRDNPYLQTLEEDIANKKATLYENISSIINTTQIRIGDIEYRIDSTSKEFEMLPKVERLYLEIQRKYKINSTLYEFLLKRRSELQIELAANMPDPQILEEASVRSVYQIAPSPSKVIVKYTVYAILLPTIFLFFIVFLNNRIMTIDDLRALSSLPIQGKVPKNSYKSSLPAFYFQQTFFTEVLRLIRIKLKLDVNQGQQVVLVTSSTMGEGKTFFSTNFSFVFALAGKKTVLLNLDFRRPQVHNVFGLNNDTGLTKYLISDDGFENYIQHSPTKNLDILVSGPVPPNPDELIESQRMRDLFIELRRNYDFIIVDTPPIGLVGDTFLINKYADCTMYVVRQNYSTKKIFSASISDAVQNEMKNINLIYNESNIKRNDINYQFYGEEHYKNIIVKLIKNARDLFVDLMRKF